MIHNKTKLLTHGNIQGRKLAIEIAEYALRKVNPYLATKNFVQLEQGYLHLGIEKINLRKVENIYILGAGKATYPIALALEEILGEQITEGFIVVKDGQKKPLKKIRITEAAHPVPDERSVEACREIFRIAEKVGKNDLILCLITGGSSSLCCCPVPSITFDDKKIVNQLLLYSGAEIREINTVRKHLSRIKGGRLSLKISPARIINLTVSDGIGDSLAGNTDWTSPDFSTFQQAVNVLKKYKLWKKLPPKVLDFFSQYSEEKETPKSFSDILIASYMLLKTRDICLAAMERARELGLQPFLLSTSLNGESRETGRIIASIAREIKLYGIPLSPPCVIIGGGETIVTIQRKEIGEGGPNQELALGGCLSQKEGEDFVFCALDSDGTDGPTCLAGALTDRSTWERAEKKGYDLFNFLYHHNVSRVLLDLEDAIITGSTGTNINDLILCVIL